mgnify:CR=1 FL=1
MKYLPLFCLLLLPLSALAQDQTTASTDSIYKTIYLDGVFETKEDFLKGRRKNYEIYPKAHRKDERYKSGTVADPGHAVRFRYKSNDKVVSKVFAITYNGFLYFQVDAITKEINRKDRFQSGEFDYTFIRAILGGQNYIYTEYEFADNWEQALVVNAAGGAGYALAELLEKSKGVVWDYWKHEFNIFRQCKDFNVFISDKLPSATQNCDDKLNLLEVRKAIAQIK